MNDGRKFRLSWSKNCSSLLTQITEQIQSIVDEPKPNLEGATTDVSAGTWPVLDPIAEGVNMKHIFKLMKDQREFYDPCVIACIDNTTGVQNKVTGICDTEKVKDLTLEIKSTCLKYISSERIKANVSYVDSDSDSDNDPDSDLDAD